RPVDELHREPRRVAVAADVVNRQDVRVVQRRRRARFPFEAIEALRRGEMRRQDLDRHGPPQARVVGLIDLSHPTGANRPGDLVGTEAGPGWERHVEVRRIMARLAKRRKAGATAPERILRERSEPVFRSRGAHRDWHRQVGSRSEEPWAAPWVSLHSLWPDEPY